MRRFAVALSLVVACTTPDPARSLGEAPAVDVALEPPAAEGASETPRTHGAQGSTAASQVRPAASPTGTPLDPAIDGAATVGDPTSQIECARPAPSCTRFCSPILGMKLEEAKGCYARVIVGCTPSGSGRNSDLACVMRDDGVIYLGSSSLFDRLGPGWRACPRDEWLSPDAPERPMCSSDGTAPR